MNIAYVRVSTEEQNEQRQIDALTPFQIDKWFCEKASGSTTNRKELQSLLDFMREGDVVHIHDFSRLARDTSDLLRLLDIMKDKKVTLHSYTEQFDTSTATGTLMLTMLAAINEFERRILLERQKEGIAIAKREGKYRGRVRILMPEDFGTYVEQIDNHVVTKLDLAKQLQISRPTLDRLIKEYKEGQRAKHRLFDANVIVERPEDFPELVNQYSDNQLSLQQIAERIGCTVKTVQQMMRDYVAQDDQTAYFDEVKLLLTPKFGNDLVAYYEKKITREDFAWLYHVSMPTLDSMIHAYIMMLRADCADF